MTEQFVVGIIRGSHGVSGEFKVESTSGEYEHFTHMDQVTLTNGTQSKVCKVTSVRVIHDGVLMQCEGITTLEQAQTYNRWQIVVPRDKAHSLKKNEWYIEDLKGCSVVFVPAENAGKDGLAVESAPAAKESLAKAGENQVVGTVTDVMEGGAGDLLQVKLSEGYDFPEPGFAKTSRGELRTVFIPFNGSFIGEVDVEQKKIQLMHLWILE